MQLLGNSDAPARGWGSRPPLEPQPTDHTKQPNYILGTKGDDVIRIRQEKDGTVVINVNGEERRLTRQEAMGGTLTPNGPNHGIYIQGLEGNDIILADESVTVPLILDGGEGNDILRGGGANDFIYGRGGDDIILGGGGRDYMDGGAGNDYLAGGDGDDVLYDGDGNDIMDGGSGHDYMDGGKGDDALFGGNGNDILMGGLGDDILSGGAGDDVMAGGQGRDTLLGGGGRDRGYVQDDDRVLDKVDLTTIKLNAPEDEPGMCIRIPKEESDEFRMRMQSDLEALRSIPEGRALLEALDRSGKAVIMRQVRMQGALGFPTPRSQAGNWKAADLKADGSRSAGCDATVFMQPDFMTFYDGQEDWQRVAPIAILFHEMVHAWNYTTGSCQPGDSRGTADMELQAVGLPIDKGIAWDHDNDPRTPRVVGNPSMLTENGLRRALGMPLRTWYGESDKR